LHTAAEDGRLEVLEALLASPAVDVNVTNNDGNTALHYFVRQWPVSSEPYCEKILQMFVWRGASLNATNRYSETPLHSCCVRKNLVALKALLQSSANPNAQTKYVL
jgi:ankyrin repeat protein